MIAAPNHPVVPIPRTSGTSHSSENLPAGRVLAALPSPKRANNPLGIPVIPPAKKPASARTIPVVERCSEKGCIFPAVSRESGKCVHHHRELNEPSLFHTRQPSLLLLDCAKFGLPDQEPEVLTSRSQERRRLTAQREAFWEGAA